MKPPIATILLLFVALFVAAPPSRTTAWC